MLCNIDLPFWKKCTCGLGMVLAMVMIACGSDHAGAESAPTPEQSAEIAEVIADAADEGIAFNAAPAQGPEKYWPHYRGPNFNGTTDARDWKAQWQGAPEIAWRADIGTSAASVIVVGDRLYTMGNKSNRDIIYALDAKTGKEHWTFEYPCSLSARQFEGGPAATPTWHDGRIYTLSHEGQFHCLDAASGKLIWKTHLVDDHQGQRPRWGYAQSPLVIDDMVIIEPGGRGQSTVALDRKTGKMLWKSGTNPAGYAAPIPMTHEGKTLVLTFKGDALVAIDPNAEGKEVWQQSWTTRYDVNATSPLVLGDLVFIASGYSYGCALFKFGADQPLWRNKNMAPQVAQVAHHDGYVYGFDGQVRGGKLACVDLKTGEQKWAERGVSPGTLIIADGTLIVVSANGELMTGKASPEGFRPLARAQVVRGKVWVSPTLADGIVYVRSNTGDLAAVNLSQ